MAETTPADLFAPVVHRGDADPLDSWRWLVGGNARPLLVTAMGDVFLYRPPRLWRRGAVLFLDALGGTCERVAANYEDLREQLVGSEQANAWLLPDLVAELRAAGVVLAQGQCYSPKLPPVLGGAMEVDNFEPTHWPVHIGLSGQIHRQVRDLPDGAQVRLEVVE